MLPTVLSMLFIFEGSICEKMKNKLTSKSNEPTTSKTGATTYEYDFVTWADEQANLLRIGDWTNADVYNIIEELEDLGRSGRRVVFCLLDRIVEHLLKIDMFPIDKTMEHTPIGGWAREVRRFRRNLISELNDQPGTKQFLDEKLDSNWISLVDIVADQIAGDTSTPPFADDYRKLISDRPKYTLEECLGFEIAEHRVKRKLEDYFGIGHRYPSSVAVKISLNEQIIIRRLKAPK